MSRRQARLLFSWVVVAALGACTAPVDMPSAPRIASPPTSQLSQLPPYKIQVGDVLDLRFRTNPELNDQLTVRPDGFISTAFEQDVPAYGRTVAEVTNDLRTRYSKDLVDPHPSLILRTFAPNRIYVSGEVTTPGEFTTIGPNLTVSQAIARAGGVKFSAERERVFIIRRGPDDVVQDFSVDYQSVIRGKDPQADVRLAQYDVLYVSRTGIGDAYEIANQYLLQFVPISLSTGLTGGLF